MYRVRQQVRCGSGLHRRRSDHLPEVCGQAPQVVQLRWRGVQGQRLLPHRQPGIVEEFGARRFRIVGVGEILGVREILGIRKALGIGEVGRVGEVEFIDLECWFIEFGFIEFEHLRPGTGLELGYPQTDAHPPTRNTRRALP